MRVPVPTGAPVDPDRSHEDASATKYLPDEVVTVAVGDKPRPEDIWQAVSQASAFVRHAETIAQTRFNNYLVADSLLLLAWATLFAGQQRDGSGRVLVVLAALSAVLGFFWVVLGTRQEKFLKLHWMHLVALEQSLSLPPPLPIGGPMEDLRGGNPASINSEGVPTLQLRRIERGISPTRLNTIGPGVLSAISLILVWVSVTTFGL
jgi:hypothetical protein